MIRRRYYFLSLLRAVYDDTEKDFGMFWSSTNLFNNITDDEISSLFRLPSSLKYMISSFQNVGNKLIKQRILVFIYL